MKAPYTAIAALVILGSSSIQGIEYTPPGTELVVGQSAIVPLQVPTADESFREVPVAVTVIAVEEGSKSDPAGGGFPSAEGGSKQPYYVRLRIANRSGEDLRGPGFLYTVPLVRDNNDERHKPLMSFDSDHPLCAWTSPREIVAKMSVGGSFETCFTYLLDTATTLATVTYGAIDTPYTKEPVIWVVPSTEDLAQNSLRFDGRIFHLAYVAAAPTQSVAEYIPSGQTLQNWTEMVAIREWRGESSPMEFARRMQTTLREQTPPRIANVYTNEDESQVMIKYVVSVPGTGEYNLWRFEGGTNGLIGYQYARRGYGLEETRAMFRSIEAREQELISAFRDAALPPPYVPTTQRGEPSERYFTRTGGPDGEVLVD